MNNFKSQFFPQHSNPNSISPIQVFDQLPKINSISLKRAFRPAYNHLFNTNFTCNSSFPTKFQSKFQIKHKKKSINGKFPWVQHKLFNHQIGSIPIKNFMSQTRVFCPNFNQKYNSLHTSFLTSLQPQIPSVESAQTRGFSTNFQSILIKNSKNKTWAFQPTSSKKFGQSNLSFLVNFQPEIASGKIELFNHLPIKNHINQTRNLRQTLNYNYNPSYLIFSTKF